MCTVFRLTVTLVQTYKWGFSFLQVFIALCLMAIWTLAIWMVWLRAHIRLSSRGAYEVPTRYQGAMRLSKAIEEEFEGYGKPMAMNSKEFSKYRSKVLKGGSVRHDSDRPILESNIGLWRKMKKWISRERWWCIPLAVHTVWLATGWMALERLNHALLAADSPPSLWTINFVGGFYSLSLWAWPSVVFAMIIGTTTKSRLFSIGCWVVIGLVIIISLFSSDS